MTLGEGSATALIMTDLLIQEIDEAVRKEHYEKLWQKHGRTALVACAALVICIGGYSWWHDHETTVLEGATAKLADTLQRLQPGKEAEIGTILAADASTAPSGIALIERFYAASLAANSGNTEGALAQLTTIQNDPSVTSLYRDLAKLLSIQAQLDTADAATLKTQLDPLAADGAPWRFSAREMQALLSLRQHDIAAAKATLESLTTDPNAPASLKERAGQILATLAG